MVCRKFFFSFSRLTYFSSLIHKRNLQSHLDMMERMVTTNIMKEALVVPMEQTAETVILMETMLTTLDLGERQTHTGDLWAVVQQTTTHTVSLS